MKRTCFPCILFTLALLQQPTLAIAEDISSSINGYTISVKVVPRIGAFLGDAYQEAWGQDCEPQNIVQRIDWLEYSSKLDRGTKPLSYRLPNSNDTLNAKLRLPEWDIITTRHPDGRKDCGYKTRRVLITVKGSKSGSALCEFKFPTGIAKMIPLEFDNSCVLYISLATNTEVFFNVDVTADRSGLKQKLSGVVPEDVLIASLGDSFASGEGNPDVPARRGARWMDSRCHRSVYAGPFRAAVRILRQQSEIESSRYSRSLSAGAVTVMSFACSGALISEGLNGPYHGVVDYQTALEAYPELQQEGKDQPKVFGQAVPMVSQLQQLEDFLDNQGSQPKRGIDLMLLSGGGNDMQFGALVTAMVTRNIGKEKLKEAIGKSVDSRFKSLESAYRTFSAALAAFNTRYPSSQVVLVKYPDPLYRNADKDCVGAIETGTAEKRALDLVLGAFSTLGQLRLNVDEIDQMRTRIIKPLDEFLDKQVAETSRGWVALDTSATTTDDVRSHGWCLVGAADAYDSQGRWFRSIIDSKRFQGNVNGSFHPTFEFTEKIQGVLIAQKFREYANSEPNWAAISVLPSKRSGDTLFVPPQPTFRYLAIGTSTPTLSSQSNLDMKCQVNISGCEGLPAGFMIGAHGATLDLDASAPGIGNPRRYERNSFMRLRVDAAPPMVTCLPDGATTSIACADIGGIKTRGMTIIVSDNDSGVSLALVRQQGPNGIALGETALNRLNDHLMSVPVNFTGDGKYTFALCARDSVGNATGTADSCHSQFDVQVITQSPRYSTISAHNIDWSNGARIDTPTIPIFGDQLAELNIAFSNAAAIKCQPSCQVKVAMASALWERSVHSIKAIDVAGNETTVAYATIRLPSFSTRKVRHNAAAWRLGANAKSLATALRTALTLQPGLKQLAGRSKRNLQSALVILNDDRVAESDRINAAKHIFSHIPFQALVVDWLNIVNGAIYPLEKVPLSLLSACVRSKGVPVENFTQIQWLSHKVQCALIGEQRA